MTTRVEKVKAILKDASVAELQEVNEALRILYRNGQATMTLEFHVGQLVSWGKGGVHRQGVVSKINTKSIGVVADGGGRWKVSPNLLRVVG